MRLNVAVSILAQTVLPLACSSIPRRPKKRELSDLWFQKRGRQSHSSLLSGIVSYKKKALNKKEAVPTKGSTANYHQSVANGSQKECDPSSDDLDTGVLSCGKDHICSKRKDTTLGGICTAVISTNKNQARALQTSFAGDFIAVCNGAEPWDNTTECDCSDFSDGVGTIVCTDSNGTETLLHDNVTESSFTYQYQVTSAYNADGTNSSAFQVCANLTHPDAPYESFCYGYGPEETSCSLSVNEVNCASCERPLSCNGQNSSFGYARDFAFDCTNTVANTQASACSDTYFLPFLSDPNATPPAGSPNDTLTDPPVAQPTDPPVEQPTKPPVAQPTNSPVAELTNPPVAQPTNPPVPEPTDSPVTQLTNPPVAVLTDPPTAAPMTQPPQETTAATEGSASSAGNIAPMKEPFLFTVAAGAALFASICM